MRCKTCDYRLWNLRARQCPECGTDFRVSDYEFIPNSVQFCCPDCGQAYYGTGHKGHLVPEAFLCVQCGRPLHMNDMVLLPAEGIEEEQTAPLAMPWLRRGQDGWWRSWWATVKMSLFSPTQLGRSLPADSPVASAWWFALATWLVMLGVVAVVLGSILFATGVFSSGPGMLRGASHPAISLMVVAPLVLAMVAVWAAITHVVLLITGGTRHGLGRTCEALCYSAGTNVLILIPACGTYFHWIWWLVSAAIILKHRQQVHGARAALALMALPALSVGLLIASIVWFATVPPTFRAAATMPSPASLPAGMPPPQMQTFTLAIALHGYALRNGGRGPQHAVELVADGQIPPRTLILSGSATTLAHMPVGDTQLDQLMSRSHSDRAATVDGAIASLPLEVVAHRLGDFVFTYHGMDFHRASRRLWTVIAWPDPTSNPGQTPDEITVGLLDGSTTSFPRRLWGSELAAQNALRTQNRLAPLPDPARVGPGGTSARVIAEQEP